MDDAGPVRRGSGGGGLWDVIGWGRGGGKCRAVEGDGFMVGGVDFVSMPGGGWVMWVSMSMYDFPLSPFSSRALGTLCMSNILLPSYPDKESHINPSQLCVIQCGQPVKDNQREQSKQAPSAQSPSPAQLSRSSAGDVSFVGVGPFHRRGRDHNRYTDPKKEKPHNPRFPPRVVYFMLYLVLVLIWGTTSAFGMFEDVDTRLRMGWSGR